MYSQNISISLLMYLTRCEKAKLYSLCMLCMLYLDTLYYEVSRIPPPRGKFQGSRMVLRFNSRTLTPPHCRTLEVWVFGVVFFMSKFATSPTSDIHGSCGSRHLESLVPIVSGHCPKCPEFWSLESVPF